MPKLKTHKGAAKRFKRKANGTIKRRRAFRNHILTKKSPAQKRRLRVNDQVIAKCDTQLIVRMLVGS